MDIDLKSKFLKLIDELELSITPNEAIEKLEGLSDDDISTLIGLYEGLRDYKKELSDIFREEDPVKYAAIEKKYLKDIENLDGNYLSDLEKLQEQLDQKSDQIDDKNKSKLNELLSKQQAVYQQLDDEHNEILSKLTSSLVK